MLTSKKFNSTEDLNHFVFTRGISKEDIVQITHAVCLIDYKVKSIYTLFYDVKERK